MKRLFINIFFTLTLVTFPVYAEVPLSDRETNAIINYTGHTYRLINAYLRADFFERIFVLGLVDPRNWTVIENRVADLDSALVKLPPVNAISYRVSFVPQNVWSQIEERKVYEDPAFLSTKATEMSTDWNKDPDGGQNVYFMIWGCSGRDIGQYSIARQEKEILFPRGSSFDVLSVRSKVTHYGSRFFEVRMKDRHCVNSSI